MRSSETAKALAMALAAFILVSLVYITAYSAGTAIRVPAPDQGARLAASPPLIDAPAMVNDSRAEKMITWFIRNLTGYGSRVPGYTGYYEATRYIARSLRGLGIDVYIDNYTVVTLIDKGSYLYVDGRNLSVYAVWPNGGVPPNGVVEGPLVYIDSLDHVADKRLHGAIALIPITIGYEWQWLLDPMIGVKAIVFTEDPGACSVDMYSTYLDIPVNIVRAYLPLSVLHVNNYTSYAELGGRYARLVVRSRLAEATAHNIIGVLGGDGPTVILAAHYDSWSPAPAVAPGEADAISPGVLYALAARLAEEKPGNRYVFLFTGAHYEALAGARDFVEKYFFEKKAIGLGGGQVSLNPSDTLIIGLDIVDGYMIPVPVSIGYFYSAQSLGITRGPLDVFREFMTALFIDRESAVKGIVAEAAGEEAAEAFRELLLDSVDPVAWWALFPGPYWLDTEPFWSSGLAAFSFKTAFSWPRTMATPIDRGRPVNMDNVLVQYSIVLSILTQYFPRIGASGLREAIRNGLTSGAPTRVSLTDRNEMFTKLVGQVRLWNATEGRSVSLREAGLPPAIVVISIGSRFTAGATWNARFYTVTDEDGYFEVTGLHGARAGALRITALVLAPNSTVLAINDMGRAARGGSVAIGRDVLGTRTAPWEVWVVRVTKPIKVPVVVDPKRFRRPVEGADIGVRIIRSDILAEPDHYSMYIDENGFLVAYVHRSGRYDLVFGPQPVEYVVAGAVPGATYGLYDAANNTLTVARKRLDELRRYHVSSPAAEEFLERGIRSIREAGESARQGNISRYRGYTLLALSLSNSAYQLSKAAYIDVENAATFFSILLVFFAIIIGIYVRKPGEQPFRTMTRTIVYIAPPAVIFYALHPALRLTANAVMTVVGFIMIILVAPALLVLLGDFNDALREIRRKKIGVHRIERSRLAASYIAFSYGVEYMKKRRLRTALTLLTLIIVVISVILFTSYTSYVSPQPGLQRVEASRAPGILVEIATIDKNLPLGTEMRYPLSVATNSTVVPRYWAVATLNVYNYRDPRSYRQIDGILGLSPAENVVINVSSIVVRGRWFRENDTYAVLIDKLTAEMVKVDVDDTVIIAGLPLRVVGIYDPDKLIVLRELDGEDIRPVKGYPRLKSAVAVMVPEALVARNPWLGKGVSFIVAQYSIPVRRGGALRNASELIYPVPAADIYASDKPGAAVYKYAQRTGYGGSGWGYVAAPLAVASISILGVMLGGLYERKREIFIYAALGLSPTQIGLMFVAEALAYALIASVIGYSLGILFTTALATAMPGVFRPNYSSGYVVFALISTITATLAATIYPIIKASKMALPSLRRKWEYPTRPEKDKWSIPLPFKITSSHELAGAMTYLYEYLSQFTSPDLGDFVVEEAGVTGGVADDGRRYVELAGIVRLKPWHAGLKQEFHVTAVEVGADEWALTINLKRLSGNPRMWVKANKPFIDAVRKQLLLWRTLHPEDKKVYIERGRELVG